MAGSTAGVLSLLHIDTSVHQEGRQQIKTQARAKLEQLMAPAYPRSDPEDFRRAYVTGKRVKEAGEDPDR